MAYAFVDPDIQDHFANPHVSNIPWGGVTHMKVTCKCAREIEILRWNFEKGGSLVWTLVKKGVIGCKICVKKWGLLTTGGWCRSTYGSGPTLGVILLSNKMLKVDIFKTFRSTFYVKWYQIKFLWTLSMCVS